MIKSKLLLVYGYFGLLPMLFLGFSSYSQNLVHEFDLDKTVFLKDVKTSNPRRNVVFTPYKDGCVFLNERRGVYLQKIRFWFVDAKTGAKQELNAKLPDLDHDGNVNWSSSIAVTDSTIMVLMQFGVLFFKYNLSSNTCVYEEFVKLDLNYERMKLVANNTLVFSRTYKYKQGSKKNNAISTLDLKTRKQKRTIFPKFDQIEYSVFAPSHWVTADDYFIYFSQTKDYRIAVYNYNLEFVNSYTRKVKNWKMLSDSMYKEVKKTFVKNRPGTIMKNLGYHNDTFVSRVEGIWSLNDSTIMVRYFQQRDTGEKGMGNKQRYFDILKVHNDGSLQLLKSNLLDDVDVLKGNLVLSKGNYQIWTFAHNCIIERNKIFIMKNTAGEECLGLGKTWREMVLSSEAFYIKNDPVLSLYIYKYRDEKE